jgi:type I restriction enzyme M protein
MAASTDSDEADSAPEEVEVEVPAEVAQERDRRRITRRYLERVLWNCAKILRGNAKAEKYKDYVFGLLLLKRCSDQFEDACNIVIEGLTASGLTPEEAEAEAEDYRHYDNRNTVYVPPEARWSTINGWVTDIGHQLNQAKNALANNNPRLRGVLLGSTIDFLAPPGGGNEPIHSEDYRELIIELRKVPLRDENLEFPDVLGAAYEYMIKHFAESSGDKGGEFYTPREIVRMMVRILEPQTGERIYDPTSGSGGMLIQSYQSVELTGDATDLMLYGQEKMGGVWAISEINMIFHSIPSTNYKLARGDTLRTPRHKETGGRLMKFERIIANMPFSMDYNEDLLSYPGRFGYGLPPATSADWLFIQHMMASLAPCGRIVTVASNSVLFKGDAEGRIRRGVVEDGWVECVIALPEKLFYNTGVPACILVLSRPEDREEQRRESILFINAEHSFTKQRKQNVIGEEHAQKICESYQTWTAIEDFSTIVPRAELVGQCSLNVRQYIDATPPTADHDVRAHIEGGVPKLEVEEHRPMLERHGIATESIFVDLEGEE